MGIWTELKPKIKQKHDWHFAYYLETPSERDDSQWYEALLFRDSNRKKFGKQEFLGRALSRRDFKKIASRIVSDEVFMKSLLSDDPSLPKIWKKH